MSTSTEPEGNSGNGGAPATDKPPLAIHAQYIKDLSFEAPNTPGIYAQMQRQSPNIQVNVNVQASTVASDTYEVVLTINAECKVGASVGFVAELTYGGVFGLNVAEEMTRPLLLIECPRLLFPFARHILANATRDGGFPPLLLGPVDFVALYQKMVAEQQVSTDAGAPAVTVTN
jgi:preprotein translocase subunit SecB